MSITFSIDIKSTINQKLKSVQKELAKLPQEAYKTFKDITPIKTGNAKRRTKLVNGEVVADYKYAEVLDKGRHMTSRGMRGSEQAPEGMSKPTMKFIKQRIRQIVRGK